MIRVLIYEKNEEEVRQDNRDQFELILSRNVSITEQRDGKEREIAVTIAIQLPVELCQLLFYLIRLVDFFQKIIVPL